VSEFEPRTPERKPGLGRSFSVVLWTWLALSLASGIVAATATSMAVDGPVTIRRRGLRALETMGYVVRGEYVIDDGALVWARWSILVCVVVLFSVLPYVIVVAARAGLRADTHR
jgi:hypothetical protein